MKEKTHYRKAFNSPYLSSADVTEPTDLTVARVVLEIDKSKKSKDLFNTAYFQEKEIRQGEPLKPMILNAHNSKMMAKLAGSKFIDDWSGIGVSVYVDCNVKFGRDTVEGLRINPAKPKPELTPNMGEKWNQAIAAYKRDGNLDAVTKRAFLSQENANKLVQQASH